MTKLAHENLARMYTKLDKHGCTYIVMDFLGGGDLFDLARSQPSARLCVCVHSRACL